MGVSVIKLPYTSGSRTQKLHNARLSKQAASSNTVDRSHQATTLVLRERSESLAPAVDNKHVGRNLRSTRRSIDKSLTKVFYSSASSWNLSIRDWKLINFVSSICDHNPACRFIVSESLFFSLMPALARPNNVMRTAVMNEKKLEDSTRLSDSLRDLLGIGGTGHIRVLDASIAINWQSVVGDPCLEDLCCILDARQLNLSQSTWEDFLSLPNISTILIRGKPRSISESSSLQKMTIIFYQMNCSYFLENLLLLPRKFRYFATWLSEEV